jgi:hypothetical protein
MDRMILVKGILIGSRSGGPEDQTGSSLRFSLNIV